MSKINSNDGSGKAKGRQIYEHGQEETIVGATFQDYLGKTSSGAGPESSSSYSAQQGSEPRVFSCNYCPRKFYSSKSFAGHQNAHKRERTLAKRGRRLGPLAHRYISIASLPLHGSSDASMGHLNRSLGIKAGSLIQKPYTDGLPPSHHGWSRFDNDLRLGKTVSMNSFQHEEPSYYWPGNFRPTQQSQEAASQSHQEVFRACNYNPQEDLTKLDLEFPL